MSEKFIYWFEEIGRDHTELVGRKCANLGEMAKLGLPVPPGFALSVKANEDFLERTNAIHEIRGYVQGFGRGIAEIEQFNEASREIRRMVESKEMPEEMRRTILSFYDKLCQKCGAEDIAVATRSAGPVSHPGQYETYLNVKGKQDLLEKSYLRCCTFSEKKGVSVGVPNLKF